MEWIPVTLVLGILVWMAWVIISSLRNKRVSIDSLTALRMLPAGKALVLKEEWQDSTGGSKTLTPIETRQFSRTDGVIAYPSYLLIREGNLDALVLTDYMKQLRRISPQLVEELAAKHEFVSLSQFIHHVALFDATLLPTLRVRLVDPTEYDLDRSGWDEEDDDTTR